MLLQLRDYILHDKMVSTQQMSREFNLDHSALQPMLDLLVKKGSIKKYLDPLNCKKSCFKCRTQAIDYYSGG